VFAIGDVRAGSVKRVGAAIGEGAAVVPQIHAFLARPGAAATRSAAAPRPSAQSARAAPVSDPASNVVY
jgi:thioredoxin reductase (NADPH)